MTLPVSQVTSTTHLQFYVLWLSELLNRHGAVVKTHTSTLNGILSAISAQSKSLSALCDQNTYFMDVILTVGQFSKAPLSEEMEVF